MRSRKKNRMERGLYKRDLSFLILAWEMNGNATSPSHPRTWPHLTIHFQMFIIVLTSIIFRYTEDLLAHSGFLFFFKVRYQVSEDEKNPIVEKIVGRRLKGASIRNLNLNSGAQKEEWSWSSPKQAIFLCPFLFLLFLPRTNVSGDQVYSTGIFCSEWVIHLSGVTNCSGMGQRSLLATERTN